jgi:hypothetical protein
MKHKIEIVLSNEIEDIKQVVKEDSSLFLAEINKNSEIQYKQEYLSKMTQIFQFPIPSKELDGHNDWMRDLDWLNKDGYVLIIHNFRTFLNMEPKAKDVIIANFVDLILPFWKDEVSRVVVEGKPKTFIIYLVIN